MKYVLEYYKKGMFHTYIIEKDIFEPYEDINYKYILVDDSLMKEIPWSHEFNEFMRESSEKGTPMFDINGNKTIHFYNVIESYYNSKEYKKIRKEELLNLLSESDWKVTVNYELIAAGMTPKYNPQVLHKDRQGWRDEINKIESEVL